MCALPKPGYDPETRRAVAAAYRSERQAGSLDEPALGNDRSIVAVLDDEELGRARNV